MILLNDGNQLASVEIPTATVTDEQLTAIIQSKIDDGTLGSATITDKSVTLNKLAEDIQGKINVIGDASQLATDAINVNLFDKNSGESILGGH